MVWQSIVLNNTQYSGPAWPPCIWPYHHISSRGPGQFTSLATSLCLATYLWPKHQFCQFLVLGFISPANSPVLPLFLYWATYPWPKHQFWQLLLFGHIYLVTSQVWPFPCISPHYPGLNTSSATFL